MQGNAIRLKPDGVAFFVFEIEQGEI